MYPDPRDYNISFKFLIDSFYFSVRVFCMHVYISITCVLYPRISEGVRLPGTTATMWVLATEPGCL